MLKNSRNETRNFGPCTVKKRLYFSIFNVYKRKVSLRFLTTEGYLADA